MPDDNGSLLPGRNLNPLTDGQIRSVMNTFLGLDRNSAPIYRPEGRTVFRVSVIENEEVSEILFGADIYPGPNVADPNASLGLKAAVAHELCHFYRHADMTEINDPALMHIDEALTSLDAVSRFSRDLSDHDIRQLVADAMHRLQLYAREQAPPEALADAAA
jgi:hypothetical protein